MGQGLTWKGHKETFWDDVNVLHLPRDPGYARVCLCESSVNVQLQSVHVIVRKLSLKITTNKY